MEALADAAGDDVHPRRVQAGQRDELPARELRHGDHGQRAPGGGQPERSGATARRRASTRPARAARRRRASPARCAARPAAPGWRGRRPAPRAARRAERRQRHLLPGLGGEPPARPRAGLDDHVALGVERAQPRDDLGRPALDAGDRRAGGRAGVEQDRAGDRPGDGSDRGSPQGKPPGELRLDRQLGAELGLEHELALVVALLRCRRRARTGRRRRACSCRSSTAGGHARPGRRTRRTAGARRSRRPRSRVRDGVDADHEVIEAACRGAPAS